MNCEFRLRKEAFKTASLANARDSILQIIVAINAKNIIDADERKAVDELTKELEGVEQRLEYQRRRLKDCVQDYRDIYGYGGYVKDPAGDFLRQFDFVERVNEDETEINQ
jgi:hypothetical protein